MISMIIVTVVVAIFPARKESPKGREFLESDDDEKLTEKKSIVNQKTKKSKHSHSKKALHFKSDRDNSDD